MTYCSNKFNCLSMLYAKKDSFLSLFTQICFAILVVSPRDGIFKLLRSPGIDSDSLCSPSPNSKRLKSSEIDSKESIPPAYVAWRASKTNRVRISPESMLKRILGFLQEVSKSRVTKGIFRRRRITPVLQFWACIDLAYMREASSSQGKL